MLAMNRLLSSTVFLLIAADASAQSKHPVDFQREDIRPILSDQCFTCHGPLKSTRKAGLRLDTPEGLTEDFGGYRPVVARKIDESHLWLRLVDADPTKKMPPPKTGKKLTAEQIAKLKQWIEEGAVWQPHWSFVPPMKPPIPDGKDAIGAANPIDRFVLARLEAKGLSPSPEADRETLIRRVTLDLTGLPPTLGGGRRVRRRIRRRTPTRTVVDRLLASPRYGERMVRRMARRGPLRRHATATRPTATRTMWPWRDWVIEALQRQHAVRPVHHRATRRRPAAECRRCRRRSRPASIAIT